MTKIKISVKWSGKKFDDIEVDTAKPATVLKDKLFELTSVEPAKQKIMVKGGMLKVLCSQYSSGLLANMLNLNCKNECRTILTCQSVLPMVRQS
jgi:hypothetical protein